MIKRDPNTLDPQHWQISNSSNARQTLITPNSDAPIIHSLGSTPTIQWFEADYWQALNQITGTNSGRGTTYFIRQGASEMVLRAYLRGGMIGKWIKRTFWFKQVALTRVYREMALLDYLFHQGVAVPQPIAGLVTLDGLAPLSTFGLVCRNSILINKIPEAQDFHSYLLTQNVSHEYWHALGAQIAHMHLCGVNHHDLNIENVMLDKHGKVWLIDFDKCHWMGTDSIQYIAEHNLSRLARSLRKKQRLHINYHVTPTDWAALLKGYISFIGQHPDTLNLGACQVEDFTQALSKQLAALNIS